MLGCSLTLQHCKGISNIILSISKKRKRTLLLVRYITKLNSVSPHSFSNYSLTSYLTLMFTVHLGYLTSLKQYLNLNQHITKSILGWESGPELTNRVKKALFALEEILPPRSAHMLCQLVIVTLLWICSKKNCFFWADMQ